MGAVASLWWLWPSPCIKGVHTRCSKVVNMVRGKKREERGKRKRKLSVWLCHDIQRHLPLVFHFPKRATACPLLLPLLLLLLRCLGAVLGVVVVVVVVVLVGEGEGEVGVVAAEGGLVGQRRRNKSLNRSRQGGMASGSSPCNKFETAQQFKKG